jgi:hypothetical protein
LEANEPDEQAEENEPAKSPEKWSVLAAEEHIRRFIHWLAHQVMKNDEDGIVPLYDTYTADGRFERGLPFRVRQELLSRFGKEIQEDAELNFPTALRLSLEEWLATELFEYHLQLYHLRPIIWLITSQQTGAPAFGCFLYWHKLDTDTLRKVQEVFLRPAVDRSRRDADRLAGEYSKSQSADSTMRILRDAERSWRQAQKRYEELQHLNDQILQLLTPQRLRTKSSSAWVQDKVNEIVAQGYSPNRDYGVRVNLEPLKQAGILHIAADRVKG